MKLAIMQPYLFPYIGYFQLMFAVDEFVVYDNIEFSKKGWVNRNRILVNGKDDYITIPIKKDSDFLDIQERYLAEVWVNDKKKMLNRILESYRKSPHIDQVYPLIEKSILYPESNLFKFLLHSLKLTKEYLEISTPFIISSEIPIDHNLKAEKKVMEICKARGATTYINPIGGKLLYNKEEFKNQGIDLHFAKANDIRYPQFGNNFVPSLSIIDVMMFNPKETVRALLNSFTLE